VTTAIYDRIGVGYAGRRRPDPRIAARIDAALGDAVSVVNVGAGTGSYEPGGRRVVALEPSIEMIRQRRPDAAPAVRGVAEALPFADGTFDACLAVITMHHWADADAGMAEMRRVSRRQVVVTFDAAVHDALWVIAEYVPEAAATGWMPPIDGLGGDRVEVVPVPHDCVDGFLVAPWRYPEAYLDPGMRAAASGFALMDPAAVERRMARLADDLRCGAWAARHRELLSLDELDVGLRIVVSETRR
jgi:SAM-dependent methyltransferase